jgi:cobalt/nickel transport system permease protein
MPRKNNFIERSTTSALSFLKESIFADQYAFQKGLLQSLDPRIKTITFLFFIVQILFTRDILVLLCFYALCLFLTEVSKINLGFFLKRTWVFMPLFSFFIAIPALFGIFTPGETWVALKIAGVNLAITHEGLFVAALFVMRVITSVSFAVLLNLTTKHFELLSVLWSFKIPQVFVMTLGMCYRYVFLFVEIIENTYLAIKSRVGTNVHYKRGQHIVAWNIAHLWDRSYQLNEEVYKAMLSRGYHGEPLVLTDFKIKAKDWFWLLFVTAIFVVTFYYNHR